MNRIVAVCLFFAILISASGAVAADQNLYQTGCSSLRHNPDAVKDVINRGGKLEDYRFGSKINSQELYITQLLDDEALRIDLEVPPDHDLYGAEAGNTISYTILVCYPTRAGNPHQDYPVPGTEIVIPVMQSGDTPFFISDEKPHPLILISHGLLMDPLDKRIFELAGQGYIVAALFHGDGRFPFPTVLNLRRIEQFSLRPLALSATIDYLLDHPEFGPAIDQTRIGGVGVSIGGSAMLALMGAKIIGPEFFTVRNTAIDHRLSAAAGIVPYMGRKGFWNSLFGWDNQGAANVHFPYFAVSSGADTIADIDLVESVLSAKPGAGYLVRLENEEHWISDEAVDLSFAWISAFLETHLKGNPAYLDMLHAGISLSGPVENMMVTARHISAYYSEAIFDLAEELLPDLFYPVQPTHEENSILYRYYPEERVFLATYANELYLIDDFGVYALGPVMYWWSRLKELAGVD